jgi:hypothetical protein
VKKPSSTAVILIATALLLSSCGKKVEGFVRFGEDGFGRVVSGTVVFRAHRTRGRNCLERISPCRKGWKGSSPSVSGLGIG